MTGAEALALAVRRLKAAGVEDAAGDARRLLAHALGVEPGRVTVLLPEPLAAPQAFFDLVARREARQPVAQITGRRGFWGREFLVTGDVLDPRPETELIVELALAEPFGAVLDLGTGTGCLLLTLLAERPQAAGTGTDLSEGALDVAERNASTLGVKDRATLIRSDWFDAVAGRYDLIVSNPPYIAAAEMADLAPEVRDWEPHLALTDGADGLTAYRAILAGAPERLTPGGRLIVEIGHRQGQAVAAMMQAAGLDGVAVHPDLEGRDRAVSGRRNG